MEERYIGGASSIDRSHVSGWIRDNHAPDPNAALTVDIFSGDEKLASILAAEPDPDAKILTGEERHGFSFDVPPDKRGKPIKVYVDGYFLGPPSEPERTPTQFRWRDMGEILGEIYAPVLMWGFAAWIALQIFDALVLRAKGLH